jgi:3-phenylpropionate/cinnamic acid dioxygenase small subunit
VGTSDATEREARQDITEVLVRYASGIDRRDWALFRTCWTDDCRADYGDIGTWEGVDALTDWMCAAHAGMGHTLHRMSNFSIAVDADTATARTYVDAMLKSSDGESGMTAAGYYDDELVRTPDGWRITFRRYTAVHFTILAPPS